ncbi:MAG: two-component sensor histidine kinase [Micrococcales bacterium 73-13]|nr:MAG: two-component sensor histidine kinase [Micrococcales bacterium 73-13]
METAGLVALALTLGFVVGAGLATILVIAARSGRRMVAAQSAALPAGIEAVIEVLEIPAVLLDPSGTPVAASAGASDAGLIDGGVHPEVLAIADQVRAEGETVRRELALRRLGRPDQVRHLRMTAALVGARYVLLVADDRSESVRLDEVRRDFVANVSHELKTPIGAVSLLAEAIDSAADDPAQVRRFTARLGEEARRLAELTQDIIELSRAQGLEPLAGSDLVRVDEVVATAIEQNRVAAVAKGIEIASRRPKERLLVLGQDAMLVTAVANLIANAVQYSPERSRVAVGMARRGDDVEITVTDQGPGIPEEEQERVFERFFRSDPARSRNTGGTGLGLSIVKHAVAGHGGSIRVWSRPGSGSTFTIVLPLAEAPAAPATHERATA